TTSLTPHMCPHDDGEVGRGHTVCGSAAGGRCRGQNQGKPSLSETLCQPQSVRRHDNVSPAYRCGDLLEAAPDWCGKMAAEQRDASDIRGTKVRSRRHDVDLIVRWRAGLSVGRAHPLPFPLAVVWALYGPCTLVVDESGVLSLWTPGAPAGITCHRL